MASTTNLKGFLWLGLFPFLSMGCWFSGGLYNASAQILPDNTLGTESSRITNVSDIRELIEGGAIRGSHLFHSFEAFNIGEGQEAYFANPVGIESIFSRVTGNEPSAILGTLGVNGAANLFFLNPNGIIFGENAQLDIRGSFVASTANRLVFDNGVEFSATNPEAAPLLTINLTPGLQYGANPPPQSSLERGKITTANATRLAVGGNLTLVAKDLDLRGNLYAGNDLKLFAQDTVWIRDSVVNSFISQAQGDLLIQGNQTVDIFALNHPDSGLFSGGEMVLQSANPVRGDAHYWSRGSFRIEKLDGSLGDLYSPTDPLVLANGDVSIGNYTGSSLHVLAGGSVTTGNILINDKDTVNKTINPNHTDPFLAYLANVNLSNGTTSVTIDGSARPTLDIRAGIDWNLLGGAPGNTYLGTLIPNFNSNATSADITIGNISIHAPDGLVFLTNQYQPNQSLLSREIEVTEIRTDDKLGGFPGNSGSVIIDYRGGITVSESIVTSSTSGNGGDITLITDKLISLDDSFIVSRVLSSTPGTRRGGNIHIQTGSLFLTNGGHLNASTGGKGNAGNVTIEAREQISVDGGGLFSLVEAGAEGNSGNISITTGSLFLTNRGQLNASTGGKGNSGNVTIEAREQISVDGGGLFSLVGPGAEGNGGNIEIVADSVFLINGGELTTNTSGKGNAGNVTIEAREQISVDRGGVLSGVARDGKGNSGNINITTGSLFLTNGGQLGASTGGKGNAGNVTIEAREQISVDGRGVFSRVERDGKGNAGNIEIIAGSVIATNGTLLDASAVGTGNAGNINIQAQSVSFTGGAQLRTTTFRNGKGGNITVTASELVELVGVVENLRSGFFADTLSTATAGNIIVNAGRLLVQNGAAITASALSGGNGGNIIVNSSNTELIGVGIQTNGQISQIVPSNLGTATFAGGNAGNLTVNTNHFIARDGGLASASILDSGEGGRLTVNASESVQLSGISAEGSILTALSTDTFGSGNAGELLVNTRRLILQDGAAISASTLGTGEGGRLTVNASEGVELIGAAPNGFASGLYVQSFADGNSRDLKIVTNELRLQDGAKITVASGSAADARVPTGQLPFLNLPPFPTSSTGNAGNIDIQARSLSINNGAQITAATSGGEGGTIRVTANTLEASNRGQLSTTTTATNDAGDIILDVKDTVNLTGKDSGIFANTMRGSTGNGGSIFMAPNSINIQDSASVAVNSQGSGEGGNIQLDGSSLSLDNGSTISAETTSNQGGNITFNIDNLLLLRHGSKISTTAGTDQAGGDGGNITINADFITGIPEEDSDITANAFSGKGGQINITTNRVIGLEFRENLTPLSDITASSEIGVDGEVVINDLGIDPVQGAVELPTDTESPPLTQGCQPGEDGRGRFVNTERGGIPPSPSDPISSNVGWEDIQPAISRAEQLEETTAPKVIVEAQGWYVNERGEVILYANRSSTSTGFNCQLR